MSGYGGLAFVVTAKGRCVPQERHLTNPEPPPKPIEEISP